MFSDFLVALIGIYLFGIKAEPPKVIEQYEGPNQSAWQIEYNQAENYTKSHLKTYIPQKDFLKKVSKEEVPPYFKSISVTIKFKNNCPENLKINSCKETVEIPVVNCRAIIVPTKDCPINLEQPLPTSPLTPNQTLEF